MTMLTCLGLLYAKSLMNCIQCTFIEDFFEGGRIEYEWYLTDLFNP